ncbi:MAG: DNA polymerase I [Planctomycetota bacterium]|nr:DNA polymerase I [Planctomycetota bacterium]
MTRTFLVDGSALAYRSYYARGPGPAYSYAASLISLIEREQPDYAIVAMDTPKPTFRHETFKEYKATRQKTPPELIAQLPTFERIADALGMVVYALPGWEADDVIGTLARQAYEAGHEVFIVSGDKDFMQVINDRTSMYLPAATGSEPAILGAEAVKEKFNCRPDQVIDVLALMGDTSDNVPGVPQVGAKTALKLIGQYEGLDDIYAKLDGIKPPSLQSRLREGKDSAYLSLDLVTIRQETPITLGLDDLAYAGPDMDEARTLFLELDFPSLLQRLGQEPSADAHPREYHIVDSVEAYESFLELAHQAKDFVFDLETTSIKALEAEIVGLAFAFESHTAWYLPANLPEPIFGTGDRGRTARERATGSGDDQGMFASPTASTAGTGLPGDPLIPPEGSDLRRFLDDLKPILEDSAVGVVGQNLKYDLLVLSRYGLQPKRIAFDTMLASYCLDAHQAQHGLDFLSLKHLGITKIPTSDLIGKGAKQISMWDVPVSRCGEYACEDADCTFQLWELFEKKLEGSEVQEVFRDIEIPVLSVLQSMETHGVFIDRDLLARVGTEMGERIETLRAEIHELAGEEFNVGSPKQLGQILFEKLAIHDELGIKRIKKTKTGFSTDASVLELLSAHPLAAKVIVYRQLTKLKGTYVDALPALIHPYSGRIHTSYNQAVAATGRLSSTDPNLQNIPIRTAEGRRIREAFVAEPGNVLLAADYSQVELRLLAHLSGDEALIDAFQSGEDIHRRTAALVFGVEQSDVSSEMRSRAKAINFGIIYGMGAQRLSREIHVTLKEAAAFIEQYFETFPQVKEWLDDTRERARKEGFVSTLAGRRRRLDGLESADPRTYAALMNMAVNTPIQGTAADLIKLAMIRVQAALESDAPTARMTLQVHDELVFEVPEADVTTLRDLIVPLMESAMQLDVPLVVDTGMGSNWLEAH